MKIFLKAPKYYEADSCGTSVEIGNRLTLIVYFTTYKWVQSLKWSFNTHLPSYAISTIPISARGVLWGEIYKVDWCCWVSSMI